ncbi:hypothetical protein OFC55_33260, partial [Escherichia coli]|nr:hypothetical protein [Escherichia coli]
GTYRKAKIYSPFIEPNRIIILTDSDRNFKLKLTPYFNGTKNRTKITNKNINKPKGMPTPQKNFIYSTSD